MTNCKNCGNPLVQSPKKRAKQFCDSTCRSGYWQKQKRILKNNKPANKARILKERESIAKPLDVRKYPLTEDEMEPVVTPATIERLEGESSLDYKLRLALLETKSEK